MHGGTSRANANARRLRIVEFTRAFYLGGTEVQVVELARGLSWRHDVRLGVMEAKGPLMSQVRSLGFAPEAFPLAGSFYRPKTLVQIARLARWLREIDADIVHVHDFSATLLVVPAAKLAGRKVVVGRLDLAHYHRPMQRRVLAELTRRADHVIANAEAIRRMLIHQERIAPERISVVHNGIDLQRFDARRREPLEAPLPDTGTAPIVVHVANMNHPVKRQEDLLYAMRDLKGRGVPVHAFLVGDGPRRRELEELTRRLCVEDVVHFLGHRKDVPAIYGRCSVGVLISSAEGLSNAIIEGMAAALPMVVTRVGGSTDLISQHERGLVIPVAHPQALAASIEWLVQNPTAAAKMGMKARAFVEENLGTDRLVERHEAVYRYVAQRIPMPRPGEEPIAVKPVARAPKAPLRVVPQPPEEQENRVGI